MIDSRLPNGFATRQDGDSLVTEISGELGGFTDELEANRLNSTVSLSGNDRNMA